MMWQFELLLIWRRSNLRWRNSLNLSLNVTIRGSRVGPTFLCISLISLPLLSLYPQVLLTSHKSILIQRRSNCNRTGISVSHSFLSYSLRRHYTIRVVIQRRMPFYLVSLIVARSMRQSWLSHILLKLRTWKLFGTGRKTH